LGAFRSVLDGFQPRGRFGDPASAAAAGRAVGAQERPRERETGTVVKTVPVEAFARMALG